MQAALRSATRRAVGISSRRGVAAVATTTTTKAAAATASEDWLAEHEKAWVKAMDEKAWVAAMVQREVRAQMAAEEEKRIARDRLRAAAEEEGRARRRRLWTDYTLATMEGSLIGFWLAMLLFVYGR